MLIASQSSRAGSLPQGNALLSAGAAGFSNRQNLSSVRSFCGKSTTAPVGGAYAMTLSGFVHQLTAAAIGAMI
ncbi:MULTISPECIES: hypothetical protein [Pseudomonas]|jgi:hypothetical protein|uniref:hypothetical protein n=1 Tax=Pseudomonas TaxID=286 RepID=UPI0003431E4B|nr:MULTISPECIES: hypothetical protein [Pseudomonas]EPA95996.1 hypothetical protein PG5_35550 [Pseudomonas sp. G5(2012)]MBT9575308.1 hypothetical protein [Pseudomonas umsongensis]